MVPLVTRQGLSATEIVSLVAEREVFIWGSGDVALDVLTSLTKAGIKPRGFLHTGPMGRGAVGNLHGLPFRLAKEVLVPPAAVFVVIASTSFRRQAEAECLKMGLRKNLDFVSHLSIARPQATVDIVSDTQLPGPWLVRNPRPASTFMDAGTFARILEKLTVDLPLLCHVELALWGDPLLHPDLARIVEVTQRVVPCTVSTNLAVDVPIDPVVEAGPSRFDINVSGFGDSYEDAIPGASWQLFTSQFASLRASMKRRKSSTRFQVRLYRSRHDDTAIEQRWRDLLQGTGIGLSLQIPYVMPYDHLLSRCEGGTSPPVARRAFDALPWDVDRTLAQCMEERNRPCLSQRIFPVVHTDLSVSLCHLYEGPKIADNYLSIDWDTLLLDRHQCLFCRRCQQFGLHRLDLEVLSRERPHETAVSRAQ